VKEVCDGALRLEGNGFAESAVVLEAIPEETAAAEGSIDEAFTLKLLSNPVVPVADAGEALEIFLQVSLLFVPDRTHKILTLSLGISSFLILVIPLSILTFKVLKLAQ